MAKAEALRWLRLGDYWPEEVKSDQILVGEVEPDGSIDAGDFMLSDLRHESAVKRLVCVS